MQTAWRERNPAARIKAAKDAIGLNPECATAYILLAEEEAVDIAEAEVKFKEAFRIAETNYRRSQQLQHQNQVPLPKISEHFYFFFVIHVET
jgi:hypothetical protein